MQCNFCGYFLTPLDTACPRCSQLRHTQPISPQRAAPASNVQIVKLQDGSSYKVCPICQVSADLRLRNCVHCGFVFPFIASPTFAQPPPLAQSFAPFNAAQPAPLSKSKQRMIEALIILSAVIGMFVVAGVCVAILSPRKSGTATAFESRGGLALVSKAESQEVDSRLALSRATTGTDLEISLVWNTTTDLDLEVIDPFGERIWAKNRESASGGVFDVDANPTRVTEEGSQIAKSGGNPGPSNVLPLPEELVDLDTKLFPDNSSTPFEKLMQESLKNTSFMTSRFTRRPVEHIYFSKAPKGTYFVRTSCYSWREPNQDPLPCTLDVRSNGKVIHHLNGTMGPKNFITDNVKYIEAFKFEVK